MPNNKGLPSVLKYVKNGKLNSSLFMWKKDSPPNGCFLLSEKKEKRASVLQQHIKIQIFD